MDSLTQIAIGIATVQAAADKELKNKTYWIGALLGTLPDLDVIIGKLFPYEMELAFHRSFTHSILGILLLSPIIGYCLSLFIKNLNFLKWTQVVALVFMTHVGIDLFTSWGVQLLYPFDSRFSFKTIFVVDIFYTLPWIIGLFMIFFKKSNNSRRQILKNTFFISSAYLFITVMVKFYVNKKVENALVNNGIEYEEYITKPTFSNIILWNINVKAKDTFYISDYSLLDKKIPTFEKYINHNPLPEEIDSSPSIKKLKNVTEGWYTVDSVGENQYLLNDLRFGIMQNEDGLQQFVFAYRIEILENGEVVISENPKTLQEGKGALKKIMNRIVSDKH